MSLLNEALRKKGREGQGPSLSMGSSESPPPPRKKRPKLLLLVLLVLCLLGGTALVALQSFLEEEPSGSLAVRQPIGQRLPVPPSEAKKDPAPSPAAPSPAKRPVAALNAGAEPPSKSKAAIIPDPDPAQKSAQTQPQTELQKQVAAPAPEHRTSAPASAEPVRKSSRRASEKSASAKRDADDELRGGARPGPSVASETSLSQGAMEIVNSETLAQEALPTGLVPFFEKARRYRGEGAHGDAVSMYRVVLERQPRHEESLFELATSLIELQQYPEAHAALVRLQGLDESRADVLVNKAIAAIGMGRTESALRDLEVAERLGGDPFSIYLHRGVAQSRSGKPDLALASYREAQTLRGDSPELQLNLAVALDRQGLYAEALEYYRAYLAEEVSEQRRRQIRSRIRTLNLYLDGRKG